MAYINCQSVFKLQQIWKKLNWEPKWTKISTVPEENMSIAKGKERVDEWCNYSSQNINPYSPLEIFFNK